SSRKASRGSSVRPSSSARRSGSSRARLLRKRTWSCSSTTRGPPASAPSRPAASVGSAKRAARVTQAGGTELSHVDLLTPTAAAIAVAVLIPLLALALGTRRGAVARRAVGLAPLGYRGAVGPAVAVALACGLLAVAVAQPVL